MKKIMVLLSNGFEAYEASVFTDVFGWNNDEVGNYPIEVVTVGMHEELKCTWNFTVKPEKQLSELDINEFDALAIPGGYEEAGFYEDAYSEEFLNVIRHFNKKKRLIASVCVGAMPIAKSGVLENRKGMTYHQSKRINQLAEFGVIVSEELFVVDDNIITCSGPGNAIDSAFKLLEMMTSKENMEKVKKLMCF